jgi:hypothetical protein
MKKGQIVRITNEEYKVHTLFMSLLAGESKPSFEGEVIAINPSREEFASLNENFQAAVEEGHVTTSFVEGVVYFDTGSRRAYILPEELYELPNIQ